MPLLFGVLLFGAWAIARSAPAVGAKRMNPAPYRDASGRVYYVIEQWDGTRWTEYGRRYMGP